MTTEYTRLRPHWRPTHNTTPQGFAEWVGGDGPNGWVKILNPDGHLVRRVLEVAPQASVLLRNHSISEQKSEMLADPEGTARRHVIFWGQWVRDQALHAYLHALVFEGINEAPIWEDGYLDATVRYNATLIREGYAAGMTFGALQMNTGWPTNHGVKDAPPDWEPFEPLRLPLLECGGYLCLHEYWDARGVDSDDWGWNPGRFTQLPDSWRGIPILITECGYDAAVNAPPGTSNAGYIGRISGSEYLFQLTRYDERLRESGWDVRAAFVFTHDWDHPWYGFDTVPLLGDLITHAQAVRQAPPANQPQQALNETTHLPSVTKESAVSGDEKWQRSVAFLLDEEGGYQNYDWDPGNYTPDGILKGTKYGISARSYPHLDIVNLTEDQARQIYYTDYWLASKADSLPWPLCLAVFDTAVLHGVGTATAWAKESNSVAQFLSLRLASYPRIKHWNQAGAGWVNRVSRLLAALGDSL